MAIPSFHSTSNSTLSLVPFIIVAAKPPSCMAIVQRQRV